MLEENSEKLLDWFSGNYLKANSDKCYLVVNRTGNNRINVRNETNGNMFHSKKINNRINSIHERALRVVYRDYNAGFSELLSKDKSVTIHQRNLQLLATEIFKTKSELNLKIMEEIFTFKDVDCNLRNNTSVKIGNLKTVYHGTESLTNLGAKIWNLRPNE